MESIIGYCSLGWAWSESKFAKAFMKSEGGGFVLRFFIYPLIE